MDTIRISLLHSKYPYLIIRSVFLIFAIYRSKVNTSLKNKICFENIYFPSKFIKLCLESLKVHTDKISLRSDERQTFYWSFKYMSNYHLNSTIYLELLWMSKQIHASLVTVRYRSKCPNPLTSSQTIKIEFRPAFLACKHKRQVA